MSGAARDIAALAAAVGVVGLLAPLGLLKSEAQRAAALAVTLAAWALLLASLVPSGDAENALDRFTEPDRRGRSGLVALVVVVAAAVIGVRVVLGVAARLVRAARHRAADPDPGRRSARPTATCSCPSTP